MKFQNFISEKFSDNQDELESIINNIKKECKQIINLYKNVKTPIYRGIKGADRFFEKRNVRTNRQPRVINEESHKLLDKLFLKHYGWKARSEGLFCGSNSVSRTWGDYGIIYIIFPIGNFKYIWTPNPEDGFWEYLVKLERYNKANLEVSNDFIENLDYAVKTDYYDKDIEKPLNKLFHDFEVILKCKSYYAIKQRGDTWNKIKEMIK